MCNYASEKAGSSSCTCSRDKVRGRLLANGTVRSDARRIRFRFSNRFDSHDSFRRSAAAASFRESFVFRLRRASAHPVSRSVPRSVPCSARLSATLIYQSFASAVTHCAVSRTTIEPFVHRRFAIRMQSAFSRSIASSSSPVQFPIEQRNRVLRPLFPIGFHSFRPRKGIELTHG